LGTVKDVSSRPPTDPAADAPGDPATEAAQTDPGTAAGDEPCLRADAERNRRRLIAAAREVFAERGLDAPMEEVARQAGVGVATLYRRFPTRDALIAGAFEASMASYADSVAEALADPDPWTGLRGHLERVCAMQAEGRGNAYALTMTFPMAKRFESQRRRAYEGLVELIDRAKATGRLRADFSPEDVALLMMANAGVVGATADTAPDAWRRLVAYLLQAFAAPADPAAEPLPPAPTPRAVYRSLVGLRRRPTRDGG
jgi:AcrR family transcriptional regulator